MAAFFGGVETDFQVEWERFEVILMKSITNNCFKNNLYNLKLTSEYIGIVVRFKGLQTIKITLKTNLNL